MKKNAPAPWAKQPGGPSRPNHKAQMPGRGTPLEHTGPRPPRPTSSSSPARAALPSELCVIGRHAVEATLRYQPARAIELFHGPSPELEPIITLAKGLGLPTRAVDLDTLDALGGSREHGAAQGVVLSCGPFPYVTVDDFDEAPAITLALDGVEDPRNFGAAVRAAYALGAGLVLVPGDRAASATAAAIKTSAGALCRVPVARATNFRRALEILQEKGAWIVGAEADGEHAPWEIDATGKIVLVIGGEDRGLRRLTREACDFVTSIPMAATDMSLNAADAATLLLYEALRQRKTAPGGVKKPVKASTPAPPVEAAAAPTAAPRKTAKKKATPKA